MVIDFDPSPYQKDRKRKVTGIRPSNLDLTGILFAMGVQRFNGSPPGDRPTCLSMLECNEDRELDVS